MYEDNYKKAQANFETLDSEYHKQLDPLSKSFIVVSHEAFGYMCDAYGFEARCPSSVEADATGCTAVKEIADFVKGEQRQDLFSPRNL